MSYSDLDARIYGVDPKDKQAIENWHYYNDDLDHIFKHASHANRPDIPSGLCAEIVDKCVSHLFPEGTTLAPAEDVLQDTVSDLLDQTKLLEKLALIATEGHVGGTVALKSVWLLNDLNPRWALDIYSLEAVTVEHDPLDADRIVAIRIRFRYEMPDEAGKLTEWWWQERWTEAEYTEWLPQRVIKGQVPNFTADMVNAEASGLHSYGEIPITLIQHKLKLNSPYGEPEIDSKMRSYCRALSISVSKSGQADQLIQTPAYVRKNDDAKDNIRITPGAIIDVSSQDGQEADLHALEHQDIPEGSREYQRKIRAMAFDAAQVTNPDTEKEMKAGGTVSSVAWKAFNLPFIKKVKQLRVRYGDTGVEAHVEKMLRMGKRLNLPGYESVNVDDLQTYEVQFSYPPFFEPTTEEKMAELYLYKQGNLPAEELARRIAIILDVQDEATIKAIQANIEEERDLLKPTLAPGA